MLRLDRQTLIGAIAKTRTAEPATYNPRFFFTATHTTETKWLCGFAHEDARFERLFAECRSSVRGDPRCDLAGGDSALHSDVNRCQPAAYRSSVSDLHLLLQTVTMLELYNGRNCRRPL